MTRITKADWYMEIAKVVSLRSTCLRAHAGAVIVKGDVVVSMGYSGSSRGKPNCCDVGMCERDRLGIEPGKNYELCESVHAEMNAVINAAKHGANIDGGKMYIYFERFDGKETKHGGPCIMCKRVLINSGIIDYVSKEVV